MRMELATLQLGKRKLPDPKRYPELTAQCFS